MGYEIYITRKEFWAEEDGPEITVDEWLTYVNTDSQLRLLPNNNDYMVILDVQSKYPEPWLEWNEGNIETKNPDEAILAKMLQIASALNARVQGEEGEIYRSASFEDTDTDEDE